MTPLTADDVGVLLKTLHRVKRRNAERGDDAPPLLLVLCGAPGHAWSATLEVEGSTEPVAVGHGMTIGDALRDVDTEA
jgi:hypothetical protein